MLEMSYLVDNAIAASADFLGDFVVVGGEVAEVGFDFVVFIGLAYFWFLVVVAGSFLLVLFVSHITIFVRGYSNSTY